jgi:hypothetical protein
MRRIVAALAAAAAMAAALATGASADVHGISAAECARAGR